MGDRMNDGPPQQTPPGPRLFVGNLSWGTTDKSLFEAFCSEQASPLEAKVIFDRATGRSRGFGFVTFESVELATMAKDKMHETTIDSRPVRVDYASGRNN